MQGQRPALRSRGAEAPESPTTERRLRDPGRARDQRERPELAQDQRERPELARHDDDRQRTT